MTFPALNTRPRVDRYTDSTGATRVCLSFTGAGDHLTIDAADLDELDLWLERCRVELAVERCRGRGQDVLLPATITVEGFDSPGMLDG